MGASAGRWDNRPMFERPVNGIAALVALAAIVLSVATAMPNGFLAGTDVFDRLVYLAPTGVGVAMLLVGGWWLTRQAPGTPFREMAIPAAVATVVPFLVGSAGRQLGLSSDLAPWTLAAAAAATLGLVLADSVPHPYRTRVTLLTAALPVIAAALGILAPTMFDGRESLRVVAMLLLAATTAVPGIVAAVLRQTLPSSERGRESVVAALELAVLGITPAISVVATWGSGDPRSVIPVGLWIVVVLAAQYFAVRPLARDATVATTQRDQIVAAMEAERSRIAADIHDDALQELTMLGWRLDASGDKQSAATAREVAERLRAILGDLRLPILDDLGTGPALEWLVERVGRLAGGEVRLERSDIGPPTGRRRAGVLPRRPGGAFQRRPARTTADHRALLDDPIERVTRGRRCRRGHRHDRGGWCSVRSLRAAQHASARGADRSPPRRAPLAYRGDKGDARVALVTGPSRTEQTGERPIRVAIVDDHPVLRDGIASLLSLEADMEVVAVGDSVADAEAIMSSRGFRRAAPGRSPRLAERIDGAPAKTRRPAGSGGSDRLRLSAVRRGRASTGCVRLRAQERADRRPAGGNPRCSRGRHPFRCTARHSDWRSVSASWRWFGRSSRGVRTTRSQRI